MIRNTEITAADMAMQALNEAGLEGFAEALKILLNEAMKIERSRTLGAEPYERSIERKGYANGYKPKTLSTRVGEIRVDVPQVRGDDVEFYPSALEKGTRSERALKVAVAEMYIQGVSTRKVTKVVEKLCGLSVTSTEVSRAVKLLDEHIREWKTRALGEMPYIYLDATYEKTRVGGSVMSCGLLIASGIDKNGFRHLLGLSVSLSEAEIHWREFIESLQERGLHGVRLVVSDDHKGLGAAIDARFTGAKRQRCQFHLQRNASSYVTKADRKQEVAADLRTVFDAPDKQAAYDRLSLIVKKYEKDMPRLSEWMEENVPESLTVFDFPQNHRRRLRTTNMLERLNREIGRRTKVVTIFPNEASLERLVAALLMETDEEWQGQYRYLDMKVLETKS